MKYPINTARILIGLDCLTALLVLLGGLQSSWFGLPTLAFCLVAMKVSFRLVQGETSISEAPSDTYLFGYGQKLGVSLLDPYRDLASWSPFFVLLGYCLGSGQAHFWPGEGFQTPILWSAWVVQLGQSIYLQWFFRNSWPYPDPVEKILRVKGFLTLAILIGLLIFTSGGVKIPTPVGVGIFLAFVLTSWLATWIIKIPPVSLLLSHRVRCGYSHFPEQDQIRSILLEDSLPSYRSYQWGKYSQGVYLCVIAPDAVRAQFGAFLRGMIPDILGTISFPNTQPKEKSDAAKL